MARYFFDVYEQGSLTRDDTGMEFPTMDDAVAEARRALAGMIKDAIVADGPSHEIEIQIRDGDEGPVALKVHMTETQ